MEIGTLLVYLMLSPVVGGFWGWLVFVLRKRSIMPDDGSITRLPCPWEPDGVYCWRQWLLLHELKGTIIVLLAASVNTGSPPILLLAFGLMLEVIKYGERVRLPVNADYQPLLPPPRGPRA